MASGNGQHGHRTLPLSWKVLVGSTAVKGEDDTLKRCVTSALNQWVWFPKSYCLPIALPEGGKDSISPLFYANLHILIKKSKTGFYWRMFGPNDSGDQGQVKVKRTLMKHRTCAAILRVRSEAHAPSTMHAEATKGWVACPKPLRLSGKMRLMHELISCTIYFSRDRDSCILAPFHGPKSATFC